MAEIDRSDPQMRAQILADYLGAVEAMYPHREDLTPGTEIYRRWMRIQTNVRRAQVHLSYLTRERH